MNGHGGANQLTKLELVCSSCSMPFTLTEAMHNQTVLCLLSSLLLDDKKDPLPSKVFTGTIVANPV